MPGCSANAYRPLLRTRPRFHRDEGTSRCERNAQPEQSGHVAAELGRIGENMSDLALDHRAEALALALGLGVDGGSSTLDGLLDLHFLDLSVAPIFSESFPLPRAGVHADFDEAADFSSREGPGNVAQRPPVFRS
jgi:hypothetical protein